jgi:hypothetical protein
VSVPARGDGLVIRGSPTRQFVGIPRGGRTKESAFFAKRSETLVLSEAAGSMLGALQRALVRLPAAGTLVALSVGIFAVSVASDARESADMTSTVSVKVMTRLADLAGASLTKLPVPTVGPATTVKASALWQDRPAVILVLRRPG